MTLLGQFDRSVGKIAAALVLGDKFRRLLDETVKLAGRIVRAFGFYLGPNLVGFLSFVVQVFENQVVLRAEVTIEGHFVGACGLGDGVDADPANAMTMEQILRGSDDALARSLYASVRAWLLL